MKGHYIQENSGKGLEVPTGRLHIEIINLPEFKNLIKQAKREADQLQNTINRLNNFELDIDFNINEDEKTSIF